MATLKGTRFPYFVIAAAVILIFSLVQSATTRAQVRTATIGEVIVQATLVRTIDTSQFSPPSPDPAGLAYLPTTNRLLISDSEVNEMPNYFTGVNVFEATLSGSLVNTWSTMDFSQEPTGLAFNANNGHLFISDDDKERIFEVNPGPDRRYGTADDVVTSFDTIAFGSHDPEGLAFDSQQGVLFIVDGINAEIYRVSPGANGIFDGALPDGDDVVTQFDTESLGVREAGGLEFNPDTGHLYVVGLPRTKVAEVTTTGQLVQLIDISAANPVNPDGLAYGPSSINPASRSLYVADRGIDNSVDPNENDGKIYEFLLSVVVPEPPDVENTTIFIPLVRR